jgi:predicted RecA/RadA family phage recombinase
MKNYVQDGDFITATAGATITAGQLVVIGSLFGVAQDSVASGAQYTAALEGVFTLAKATGASTGPAQGAPVYRISASNLVTAASSGNTLCGYAFEAAADGASTVRVRLLG